MDHENSCRFSVKFIRPSLPCPPVDGSFSSTVLETRQRYFLKQVQKPFIGSHHRQFSHKKFELGRQPEWLFTIDGSGKECVFIDLEKYDNFVCVCVLCLTVPIPQAAELDS